MVGVTGGMATHSIEKHTDIIRSIFIPLGNYTSATLAAYLTAGSSHILDATDEYVHGVFVIPADYVSGGVLKVFWCSGAVLGTYVINASVYSAGDNETGMTRTDAEVDLTIAVDATNKMGIDALASIDFDAVGATDLDVSPGDIIRVKLDRDANTTQNLYVFGFIFEYLANQ